ncbi:MAG TPA: response regulator [Pyrinomonadaceae bacterium]|jgi:CheY-like chemotaxis protein|nr:response regulator [Pyrinomonadaceae bacterium]
MLSVLIVEDDPTLRDVLYDIFSEDFPCRAVKSVEEALERLESERYGIVLTDISMPGKSGLELLGCIKQKWPEIPVIMFSGIDDEEYSEGLFKIGAFDYLPKPFTVDSIVQSVTRALMEHPALSNDALGVEPEEAKVPAAEGQRKNDNSPVFASVQLGGIVSLAELLDIVQRGKMSGYIELHWDNQTISQAKELGRFNDASGSLDEAVSNCCGWLYLKEGLIIDAVIDESEGSPYWRDAEQSLAVLVKLATYVSEGVRAWGFSMTDMERPAMLSIRDNSAKVFNIITADEGAEEEGTLPYAPPPEQAFAVSAGV